MSRGPANFIEADVARALRAAQQAGPDWRVEIEGGVILLMQTEARRRRKSCMGSRLTRPLASTQSPGGYAANAVVGAKQASRRGDYADDLHS